MQTTNHSPQTLAHGLASLGRYGDTYMVHAAEGETVIPAEILQANPRLKADLFRQMQMMGIKDPNRYVVGNSLNSLNPVTGQPEFFYKKIFRAFKAALPAIGAVVGNRIAPGVGNIVGTVLGSKASGQSWKKALGSGALTYLTDVGIGAARRPDGTSFFEGLKTSAVRPFQATKAMFTDWGTAANPFAQGALGSLVAPAGAEQFKALGYEDRFYPQYRTAEDMAPRQADLARLTGRTYTPPPLTSNEQNIMASTAGVEGAFGGSPYSDDFTAQNLPMTREQFHTAMGEKLPWATPAGQFQSQKAADIAAFGGANRPSTPFFKQPFLYEAGIPLATAALLGGPDEGEISAEEARETGDPEYADYVRYRSAAPGSEREQARRAAGITPAIDARRLAQSMGISLEAAQSYLESMYGGDAGFRNVAGGGEIMGPGTGTSDSIPARLSDGEFVMTADAVRGAGNGDRNVGAARMYDLMSQFEGAA